MGAPAVTSQIATLRAQVALRAGDPAPIVAAEIAVVVAFTFASGVLIIGALPTGAALNHAQVVIAAPFNGAAPSIRFGTSGFLDRFLAAADITPGVVGQYASDQIVVASAGDVMLLSVQAPSATQGSGLLFYRLVLP